MWNIKSNPIRHVMVLLLGLNAFFVKAADSVNHFSISHNLTFSYLEGEFPFSYTRAGKPAGMSIDVCEAIVQQISADTGGEPLKINWIKVTPAARFQSLLNHSADIECSNITNTPERRKFLLFSLPYFYASTTFISHKENHLTSTKMLAGHTLYVTSGDIAVAAITKLNVKLGYSLYTHLSPSAQSGFQSMEATDNSVFVADDVLLYSLRAIHSRQNEYQISRDNLIDEQPFALVMRPESTDLQKLVNKAMVEIFSSGQFETLYNKWFLSPVPPDNILINMPMPPKLKQDIEKSHT